MQSWQLGLVLAGIVLALLYVLRRERPAGRDSERDRVEKAPLEVVIPRPLPDPAPLVPPAVPIPAVAPPTVTARKPRKKRPATAVPGAKPPPATKTNPIAMALSLLRKRESLVTAVVLREILDSPVSRRRK